MNILHININYSLRPLHQELVRGIEKYGHKEAVFVPISDKHSCKIEIDDNVILSECFNKCDRFLFRNKQNKIYKACLKEIEVKQYDIIHAHTLFTDGNVAMRLSKYKNVPYLVAIRNTDVNVFFKYRPWLIPLGTRIMLNAEKVIFLSEAYKSHVISNYVKKKYRDEILSKAVVLPNGIDDFWLEHIQKPKSFKTGQIVNLLSVCEIDKNKNIFETVEAMKILKEKGYECRLTLIGRPKDKKIIDAIKKNSDVHYYPPMPKENLIEHYSKSDIFVMPSHTESFGLVYAEALSQGLPIVYTRGQGFDGQFEDGTVGYSVSDVDSKELSKKIIEITDKYNQMSKNAIDGCRKFSWSLIAEEYSKLYECCNTK